MSTRKYDSDSTYRSSVDMRARASDVPVGVILAEDIRTIDERIEAAAQDDNPIRALRDLADDASANAADYDRVIDQIDTIRRDAEEAAS
jgi:hypothetical protein